MHHCISIGILKSLPKYLILSIVIALSESKLGAAQIIVLTTLSVELNTLSNMAAAYGWVPFNVYSRVAFPQGAVSAGVDADGSEIYVGRAQHEGDLLTAKVIPAKSAAYVSFNGAEVFKDDVEHMGDLLTAKVIPAKSAAYVSFNGAEVFKDDVELLVAGMLSWQPCDNGAVPQGAISAGTTADGETLYVGRVLHDGCITPGKVHQSHGCVYYPFNGEEMSSKEYEVLVYT
ncbi:unnamed protein product [Plutella xylostella]|uniref:(diamondback moth) hypothetical protein n=1 Tax=Plutella xylostella TaxID=51655 RepID=A0A8S4G682_PLUXY|nr:unnamed protein product [Plutella xylostella]